MISKPIGAISSQAASTVSNVELATFSIFVPLQGASQKIIETDQALHNMEHDTALSNAAKALLSVLNSFDAFTTNLSANTLSVPASKLENIISTSIDAAKIYATNIDEALLDDLSLGPVLNSIQHKAML
jgi:predicted nucleotide-binding protein